MAVCKMDVLALGQVGTVRASLEGACGRREAVATCATPKRVTVSAKLQRKWPSGRVGAPSPGSLGVRCSATFGRDDEPKKVLACFWVMCT